MIKRLLNFAFVLIAFGFSMSELHAQYLYAIAGAGKEDDPSTTFDLTIFEGTLETVSDEKFILTAKSPSSDDEATIEFRRR